MTVERLIEILEKMPADAEVGVQVSGGNVGARIVVGAAEIRFVRGFDPSSLAHEVRNTFVVLRLLGDELEDEDKEDGERDESSLYTGFGTEPPF